ncbi:hypothetical protein CR513_13392, partial [Mucuna pruriens]
MKHLEVVDLFDIKQNKGETLKNYLARYNNATVFQKGLRMGQFSDSLTLRKPLTMEEIRAWAEKHIEVDLLEVERQPSAGDTRPTLKGENKYPTKPKDYPLTLTPLHEKRTQILPYDHSTKDCHTLQEIERLVHEGNLGQYIRKGNEKTPTSPRASRKVERGEAPKGAQGRPGREEKQRERSRSPQRRNTRHKGVITTISGGGGGIRIERSRKRKASDVLVVRGKANVTPTPVITFGEKDMQYDLPRHDKPIVISVVVAEYKVERVLINQGSSANILYWSTYMKMGLKSIDMEPCTRRLYGFASEQVEIRGVVGWKPRLGKATTYDPSRCYTWLLTWKHRTT